MKNEQFVKVWFALDDESEVETEALWGERAGTGSFALANIPLFTVGVAIDDVVSTEFDEGVHWATAVIGDAGHVTLWIEQPEGVEAAASATLSEVAEHLESLGFLTESEEPPERLAVDVVNNDRIQDLLDYLGPKVAGRHIEVFTAKSADWWNALAGSRLG